MDRVGFMDSRRTCDWRGENRDLEASMTRGRSMAMADLEAIAEERRVEAMLSIARCITW
jgi:hypothetical protein